MARASIVREQLKRYPDGSFAELTIWRVPTPVRGSWHKYKYSLALVVDGVCVLRYDNEAGKGDHKHVGAEEHPYDFVSVDRLRTDFLVDARRWLVRNGRDPGPEL